MSTTAAAPTRWYHWVLAVLAGAALTNAIPHFVNGISGNEFPTPFANPPLVGMSPPIINVFWGFANLVGGYALLRLTQARIVSRRTLAIAVFAGVLLTAVMLSLVTSAVLDPIVRALD